jgi:hypothetical protein
VCDHALREQMAEVCSFQFNNALWKHDEVVLLTSQIGILVPRRDQSRADGAVGTGESLRCPIASPYLNTLLIFILSDT